jgi:hypothetical protein
VPVGATLALPVLWIHGLAMLAGAVPLALAGRDAGAAPNEIPTRDRLLGALSRARANS